MRTTIHPAARISTAPSAHIARQYAHEAGVIGARAESMWRQATVKRHQRARVSAVHPITKLEARLAKGVPLARARALEIFTEAVKDLRHAKGAKFDIAAGRSTSIYHSREKAGSKMTARVRLSTFASLVAKGIAVVEGAVVVRALRRGDKYHATWLRQSRGYTVVTETGWLVKRGGEWHRQIERPAGLRKNAKGPKVAKGVLGELEMVSKRILKLEEKIATMPEGNVLGLTALRSEVIVCSDWLQSLARLQK